MTLRFFDATYTERATLRDGTRVVIRLVRADDKDVLRRAFDAWSPASRYARFLSPKNALTDPELRYLTEVDAEDHLALGALHAADASIGLGIARWIRLRTDRSTAEAAIAVADSAQNRGLGRLLLARLVASALERDIATFTCDVLGTNEPIQRLLASISPAHTSTTSAGVTTLRLPLRADNASPARFD